jgi:hypothetical protein
MFLKWIGGYVCGILLAMAPASLYAADCFDRSPALLAGKGLFAPVVPRDLTPTEQAFVRRTFQSLDGDWKGQGDEIQCKSTTDSSDREETLYDLRAAAETDGDSKLLLKLDIYDIQNQTSYQMPFRLYLSTMRLRYEHDGDAGDVELLALDSSEIKFIYRVSIRGRSRGGTPMRKAFVISLITKENAFAVHRDIYTRGKLTTKWRWRFQRE